jgi:hypothetical protein
MGEKMTIANSSGTSTVPSRKNGFWLMHIDDVTMNLSLSSFPQALPFAQPDLDRKPARSSLPPGTLKYDAHLARHRIPKPSFDRIAFLVC